MTYSHWGFDMEEFVTGLVLLFLLIVGMQNYELIFKAYDFVAALF